MQTVPDVVRVEDSVLTDPVVVQVEDSVLTDPVVVQVGRLSRVVCPEQMRKGRQALQLKCWSA